MPVCMIMGMVTLGPYLAGYVLIAIVFGVIGAWVGEQCGRGEGEGFVLGLLLGPFGVLIEAMLPKFPDKKN